MTEVDTSKLDLLLDTLLANIREVSEAFIISSAGPISHRSKTEHTYDIRDRALLLSTAINSAVEFLSRSDISSEMEKVTIEHLDGVVSAMNINNKVVLAVICGKYAKMGLVYLEMGNTAKAISDLLGSDFPDLILKSEGDDVVEYIDDLLKSFEKWEESGTGKKL